MKHNIFKVIILIVLSLSRQYHSQSLDANIKSSIQNGDFICRTNNRLVYSHTDDDGEYPLYTLNSLKLSTGDKEIIDSQLTVSNCVKLNDSTLGYTKSDKMFLWNSNTKKRSEFIASKKFSNIIGLGFNQKNKCILVVEANYKAHKVKINIFDERNRIIFDKQVEFNEMEVEGIFPKIESIENYFVLKEQYNLYVVDLKNTKPNLEFISDGCADFALNDTVGILYYKYITFRKIEEYFSPFGNRREIKTTNLLNEKINNCANLTLFTAIIDNKLIPGYLICGTSFVFSEQNWHSASEAVIYKDDKLIVKYPTSNQKMNDSSFEWKLQGF